MDGDGGEVHGQAAGQHDAALDGFYQLRRVAMAGVVGAARVGNADHGPFQGRIGVARALDEGFAQEQGKALIAVMRQALFHARRWVAHESLLVISHRRRRPHADAVTIP